MNPRARHQRGGSLFLVLIVLATLMLSGLALARMTDTGTLLAGNLASRAAALQAAEVGVNNGYAAVKGLTDEESTSATGWYLRTLDQNQTAQGLPNSVAWSSAPTSTVGAMTVSYYVERVCDYTTAAITDATKQCLLKEVDMPVNRAEDPGDRNRQLDNPSATQFRITTRVTDQRNTTVYVQALVTKGSN
jgi:Tfp pilus assembly protein PilX